MAVVEAETEPEGLINEGIGSCMGEGEAEKAAPAYLVGKFGGGAWDGATEEKGGVEKLDSGKEGAEDEEELLLLW